MNFVMSLTHHSLSGSVLSIGTQKYKGLRFDSSVGLRIFSMSHARNKTKNVFLHLSLVSRTDTPHGVYYNAPFLLDRIFHD